MRSDVSGKMAEWLYRKGISVSIPFYLLATVLLGTLALVAYLIANFFLAIFLAASAVVALYALWHNRKTSISPVILRKDIESVSYQAAVPGQSRARFVIKYRPKKRELQRNLALPTATHQGTSIADTAYWMMREEGLVDPNAET